MLQKLGNIYKNIFLVLSISKLEVELGIVHNRSRDYRKALKVIKANRKVYKV